jgi:hypothetical protein
MLNFWLTRVKILFFKLYMIVFYSLDTIFNINMIKICSKIFIAVHPDLKLILEKGLNEVFGFQQTTFMGGEEIYSSNVSVIPYSNDIYSLFIYSYICEYQLVGDNEAPLLQVVSTTNVN